LLVSKFNHRVTATTVVSSLLSRKWLLKATLDATQAMQKMGKWPIFTAKLLRPLFSILPIPPHPSVISARKLEINDPSAHIHGNLPSVESRHNFIH